MWTDPILGLFHLLLFVWTWRETSWTSRRRGGSHCHDDHSSLNVGNIWKNHKSDWDYLFVIISEMSELCEVLITSSHHQVTLLHWSATEWDVHGGGWPPGQYVDTVVMTGSRMTREKADILTLPLKMVHKSQQSEIHQNPDLRYNSISDLRISWLRGLK